MQPYKVTKKKSEFEIFKNNSEKLTSSLITMMEKFKIKKHIAVFDFIKSKGFAVSSIVQILVILPFMGIASINSLIKAGIKVKGIKAGKDIFYDIKNNELINWRRLLMLHTKRFIYLINHNASLQKDGKTALIFDDTTLEKTGKNIENVSMVHDHTSTLHLLGYKLLVCGFWDGGSFIPVDFSFHREKGKKHFKLRKLCKKLENEANNLEKQFLKLKARKASKAKSLEKKKSIYNNKATRTNKKILESSQSAYNKVNNQYNQFEKKLSNAQIELKKANKRLKNFYDKGKLYGLSTKERKAQYKKKAKEGSPGKQRRKEADMSKILSMLKMLSRAVKQGIIADYVITDSWFFCFELLNKLKRIKKGSIKLISMVALNNQNFTLCSTGKTISVKAILNISKRKIVTNKKYKAKYIKVPSEYRGIRVNLFFVKMGKSERWHLLATTDLTLNFNKLIELYQIRWSIEVFFKDAKQYLKLGSCQSNCFDAQVADTAISMLQYIMLIYFKRVNYQQSFGDIFKQISSELVEIDIISGVLQILKELIELLCEMVGINILDFQEQAMANDKIMNKFINLYPDKLPDKAA